MTLTTKPRNKTMSTATKPSKAKTTLIDADTKPGAYDMPIARLLVDHAELCRLLILQGFGGMDQLCGGAYRWRHGIALSVPADATLASLDEEEAEYGTLSDTHPIIDWDGVVIDKIAQAIRK